MAQYILMSGIILMALTFMWSSNSWLNIVIKMILFTMVLWSAYLLLGPTNLIAQL